MRTIEAICTDLDAIRRDLEIRRAERTAKKALDSATRKP